MGYADQSQFQQSMTASRGLVPCMMKTFGLDYCPHCEKANQLFAEFNNSGNKEIEKNARALYRKRMYFSMGIVYWSGKPQDQQICLVNWPANRVKEIMENTSDQADPRLRWPNPDDLANGRPLVLQKYKKDAQFSDYKVQLIPDQQALDPEWWSKIVPTIPDMADPKAILEAFNTWPDKNRFQPKAMADGEAVTIRMLPSKRNSNGACYVPFGMLNVHYTEAMTDWDRAWEEVGYDITRKAEVYAKLGMGGTQTSGGYMQNAMSVPGAGMAMGRGGMDDDLPF